MQTIKLPLPYELDYHACQRAEAALRKNPDIAAAFIGHGFAKLMFFKTSTANRLKAAASLSAVLGANLLKDGHTLARGAKNTFMTRAPASDHEIEEDFKGHRRNALISLGFFVFFEILKRTSPTTFASTTLLRSAAALIMSSELIKNGLGEALRARRPNADTLTLTAVLASVAAGRPESSLSLLTLSNCAEMITTMAARKARSNISKLVALDVRDVWVKGEDGIERKVPLEQIQPGMIISVHAGEKICVDGTVTGGSAAVDQAAITGESIPAAKKEGDRAWAGTVVNLGELAIRVEKVGDDTSLARIVHMVEDANNRKAPIQNYADTMATALVPVSFFAAVIVYAVTHDLQRVLNMLFIDFSCGLKLSTATAISAAISRAAKSGILVKGGSFIEEATHIDTVILDKTGTITKGKPSVVKINCAPNVSADVILMLSASAEKHSSHPMAVSILSEAQKRKLEVPEHEDTETVVARGIRARIAPTPYFQGGEVLVGSQLFMQENQISNLFEAERTSPTGSFIYVSGAGRLLGIIEIDDPIRDEFKRTINRMRYNGIEEIKMLTGDSHAVAAAIADSLGLDGYEAEVLPEDKATFVNQAKHNGKVLMVGDGINDAPALAYADIGVAMGTGCTDTAMESADVTINSEDPLKLPEFINIGKKTMHLVRQNFHITIAVNTVAMMLGALGVITPLLASVVHNASTLGVVLNSGRVLIDEHKKPRH